MSNLNKNVINHKSKALRLAFFTLAVLVVLFGLKGQAVTADDSAIAASEWEVDNLLLSTQNQKASIPSIAVQNNGTLHAAFKQGANPVYVSSSNGGTTWTSPQTIRNNANATVVDKVDIAVSDNGVVHAAWIEINNTNLYTLLYASKSGANWGSPETIESSPFPIVLNQSSLAVKNGRVYLVWERINSGIQFAKRSGGTWATPTEILGTSTARLPEIAIDANENLHIIYLKRGTPNSARYIQSGDLGATWTGNVPVSSGLDVKDVDLVLDGSNIHVTFGAIDTSPSSSSTEAAPYYTVCVANCGSVSSWSAAAIVTNREISDLPVDAPFNATIAITEKDQPLVFFHGAFGSNQSTEQVLGTCYQPSGQTGKDYNLPTIFTERMVNPQIVYSNGLMHMVYEKVVGQGASASLREVRYARLAVSCYDVYLPLIFK